MKAELDLIGVSASAVRELGGVAAWLRGELPMLRRRQAAAVLLASQRMALPPGVTMQSVPDDPDQALALAGELAARRLLELKVVDPGSRERAMELAAFLAQYGKDPAVANKVMQTLGPEGLQKAVRTLRSLTTAQPPYFVGVKDPSGEHKAVLALQDQLACSLALMLSTASKNLDQDWGRRFGHDTWTAGILLRYADKQNLSFGRDFYRGVGHALKDREQGDPLAWDFVARDPDNASFGTESLTGSNPMREYLNTADNSAGNAQGALGDDELRQYFLRDRRYQSGDTQLDQVGRVLERATVGAARSSIDDEARTAADISSHVLWMTKGDNTKPLSAFTDEVAGILATYLQDVDRAVNGGDLAPGSSQISEYRIGIGPGDGLARFEIGLDTASLKSSLSLIRDDEVAKNKVGQAITLFNQTRMDWGAKHHKPNALGDPFAKTARESAQLQSFFTAESIEGDLDNLERRLKAMDYWTAPFDNLNSVLAVGKVPLGEVINDGIIGAAKEAAADRAVQKALQEANETDGRAIALVQLQAAYAAVRAMPDKGRGRGLARSQRTSENSRRAGERRGLQDAATHPQPDRRHRDRGRRHRGRMENSRRQVQLMLKRRRAWLLATVAMVACAGCQFQEPPKSLCGEMPAPWFSEATGEKDLKSSVEVERGSTQDLPLRWDAQHPFEASDIKCRVMDGDDMVVEFSAELRPADELNFSRQAVDGPFAEHRFTAAGGRGGLLAAPGGTTVSAYWLCGSNSIGMTIFKFASDDKAGLTRQLTERIAGRVGCTLPYTPPTPTPSN